MIEWLSWSGEVFSRAARDGKPVLLSITAAWCGACQEMDRTTFDDPEVAALIAARFVAVRVDTDRRPDINERYNLGGWPTTAFLTPSGAIIAGGTFIAADRMTGVLNRVAAAFNVRVSAGAAPSAIAAAAQASATGPGDAQLIESIFATFDDAHGGFGTEPKFPHAAPLHLALALFRQTGEDRWRRIVEGSLDAMAERGLWDAEHGGFFRYATTRDWQRPHDGKLLETNAELLRVCAEAALVFERPVDRDRCAAVAAFITTTL
ncbi:MAG: DUF255 domain-containing protein, partial [Vicinamibacterales bacterium]